MRLAVLFDLDETLLQTNTDQFLPKYFDALGQALSDLGSQEMIMRQLRYAVSAMFENEDPAKTLRQVFVENFYKPLGTTEAACQKVIEKFYRQDYPKLKQLTQPKKGAKDLVAWCRSQGLLMGIATNPLFPETATRQRIEWSGLDLDDFVFFSNYDEFHFTKPNLTFYAESLGRMGWPEAPAVMIGDNLTYDLLPMENMGFEAFWVDPEVENSDRPFGTLVEAKSWLETISQNNSHSVKNDPEVNIAVLRATPSVIDTWLKIVPEAVLYHKPEKREWSIVETLWHLADFEREIHQPQWEQLNSDPSIPIRPVTTSSWAENRDYQSRQPADAFNAFLKARQSSLSLIQSLWDKGLFDVSVQHTIYSEAQIRELVGFSAKHDQLHLRQCFNLLNIC